MLSNFFVEQVNEPLQNCFKVVHAKRHLPGENKGSAGPACTSGFGLTFCTEVSGGRVCFTPQTALQSASHRPAAPVPGEPVGHRDSAPPRPSESKLPPLDARTHSCTEIWEAWLWSWLIPCLLPTLLSSYTQPPPAAGCHGPLQEAAPVSPKLFTYRLISSRLLPWGFPPVCRM